MRDKRKPSILANVPSPSVTDPRFKERGSILSRGNRKRTRLDEYACIKGELTKHLQMLSGGDSRNNNFNLLRFLFATGVIFGHSFDFVDNSTPAFFSFLLTGPGAIHVLSVDGFFLLSGFLITQSWLQCPVLGTFLTKRILRIYPGFVVASAISVFIVGPHGQNPSSYFKELSIPHFFIRAFSLHMPVSTWVNGSLWTIEYEFRCYLMIAILGLLGLPNQLTWTILSLLAFVCALIAGPISTLLAQISLPRLLIYCLGDPYSNLRFISLFITGGSFYFFRHQIKFRRSLAAAAAAGMTSALFVPSTLRVAIVLCGGYCLFYSAFLKSAFLAKFRKVPDVSYGVYLYGFPIQKLLLWHVHGISATTLFLLAMPLSCIAGLLSWHLVERPFLRLKPGQYHRDVSKAVPSGA